MVLRDQIIEYCTTTVDFTTRIEWGSRPALHPAGASHDFCKAFPEIGHRGHNTS